MAVFENTVRLRGNVGSKSFKILPTGQECFEISLAIQNNYTNAKGKTVSDVQFIPIHFYGEKAKSCRKHVKVGDNIDIVGRLQWGGYKHPKFKIWIPAPKVIGISINFDRRADQNDPKNKPEDRDPMQFKPEKEDNEL